MEGHCHLLHILVTQLEAKVTMENGRGETALDRAAWNGKFEAVKTMLDLGADVLHRSKIRFTALHYACDFGNPGVSNPKSLQPIARVLLEAGVNVNEKDEDGWNCLHLASANGHSEVLQVLLEAGVDILDVDEDGNTALHLAAAVGHAEVAKVLVEAAGSRSFF